MAKKRRRNVARDKILDQLIGRALLTSEAVRKEFMERLVDAIVDVGWNDEQGIIAVVRAHLTAYEPLLAEHLSNAMILTWLGGYIEQTKHLPTVVRRWMRDHAYWAQLPPEVPGIFGTGDKSPPAVRFPRIEKATESLFNRGLMTRPQYDRLSAAAKQATFTVAYIDDTKVIGKIRDALAEATAEGPTLDVFRRNVVEKLEKSPMSAWHSETVYRTNLMSAYRDGKESLMQHPIVQEVFPFRQYFATHDGRVRDEHLALETLGIQGTGIYYNEDPVWDLFSVPWDYNCRCITVPMRIADAARAGIKEAQEWLRTGVKPANPTYCLGKISFRPKEGFGVRHGPLLSVGTSSSVRMSSQPIRLGDVNPWAPYKGPRGGTGWQHSGTGDVRYVKDRPGASETGGSDASKPQTVAAEHAAGRSASEVLSRIQSSPQFSGREVNWDKYAERWGVTGTFHEIDVPAETILQLAESGRLGYSSNLDQKTVDEKHANPEKRGSVVISKPGNERTTLFVLDGTHGLAAWAKAYREATPKQQREMTIPVVLSEDAAKWAGLVPATPTARQHVAEAPKVKQISKVFYRASEDDYISDSASFTEDRETAEAYLNNPGFGGRNIYRTEVKIDPEAMLDIADENDPMAVLLAAIDSDHDYGAIGVDELVPRIADQIADAGYQWVRVSESYPSDTITWIYVGGVDGDEPELVEDT